MKTSCPIVDIHASWLALNPIHGCPYSCKYCFLNGVNLTSTKPEVFETPQVAVQSLLDFKLYEENFPLCLFTSTDIFATQSNIDYCIKLLEELYNKNVKNPIVFITKQLIPDYFLDIIDMYESKSMKFVFLLSFSGLDKDIEVGIRKKNIKQNFINLHNRNKRIIHYWRPFLPENSTLEVLNETYNFVKNYASCSISIGLKVQPNFINNLNFWSSLFESKENIYSFESIWTKNAYEFMREKKHEQYPIFNSTSCALSYTLGNADYNGFFNSDFCSANNCPQIQKQRCKELHKKLATSNIDDILNKFMHKFNYKFSFNANFKNNTIIIDHPLKTSEIVYLKMLTNMNIVCNMNNEDYYWATTNSSNKILILEI